MRNARFSDEFKHDTVHQTTEQGYPVAEGSPLLGVSLHSLLERRKKFSTPAVLKAKSFVLRGQICLRG